MDRTTEERIIPPADDLIVSEEHREIESETIKLEQEAVVVFTDIVCLELHMRFFEEKESKFTRYRCCRRRDLPSKYNTADPPAPGTWARITYTSTDDSYQHIAIQALQDLEFESNLGAIIRYAKELVQPKNQKIWTALLNGSHRIITLQQLMEETKSPEETDSSGSEAEFEHFPTSKNAQIEGQEKEDEEADVQLEDEETDDDNSVKQFNYGSDLNQINREQSTSTNKVGRPISDTTDEREKQAIVLFTEATRNKLYMRFFDQHSGQFKRYCYSEMNNSHLQQRPAPGSWAQINYQNLNNYKTNKIMITNCQAIEDFTKSKFKTILYTTMHIVCPENAEIWNLLLKEKHKKWTVEDLISKLLEMPLSSCPPPPFPSCSSSKVSNSSVPLHSSSSLTFSSPLLCQESKHFDSAFQMCGIVVRFMSNLSSTVIFVYQVWPFCTGRSKPRLLFLDSPQQLPLGHWLKFGLRDYEVGRIRSENCSGMKPWFCTKTNSQNVFIECCITIPSDFGTAPEAEIWTYSWKNKCNEKVPFICKILPKSVDIENALKKSTGKRCIGRMMFEPYLDHTGVSRGYWSIDGYWAIDKKKH